MARRSHQQGSLVTAVHLWTSGRDTCVSYLLLSRRANLAEHARWQLVIGGCH